jgi:competence protein ComEA
MRIISTLSLLLAATAFAEPGVCPDGRININEASQAVFARLKGVGAQKAEAIVTDRATHGRFANVAALNRVEGVGDKSLESWAAQITTDCNAIQGNTRPAGEAALLDDLKPGRKAPAFGEPGIPESFRSGLPPLNLNTATAEQLADLPGVGPKTAEAIIALRTQKGGAFKSTDELGEVKGIGAAKLEKLKPLLVTTPAGTGEN